MKSKHRPIIVLIIVAGGLLGFSLSALAENTERLVRKFIGAANSASRGNVVSAANQVIPGQIIRKGSTQLRVAPSSIGVSQAIPGASQLNNSYLGFGASANAGVGVGNNGKLSAGCNIQVKAGNQHIQNTTTFK